jgi:hypothetical protein
MFSWESVESFLLIGVITAGIVWYGIVLAWKEDLEQTDQADRARRSA